jgi:hypothetical protein
MRSRLYPAVVLVGISWGTTAAGCLGRSTSGEKTPGDDPDGAGAGGRNGSGSAGTGGAVAGNGGPSAAGGGEQKNGTGGAGGGDEANAGAGQGAGASAGGGTPWMVDADAGEGGAPDERGGAGSGGDPTRGGVGGGVDEGGITDAGIDAPLDAFCDTSWPTTKGNPALPPTCEDQAECGGPPPDAGWRKWLECHARLGDHQCDYYYVTSVCEGGEWTCPSEGLLASDCHCFGPVPHGKVCTEQGFADADAGSGGGT